MVNWEFQKGKYVRDPRLGHRFGLNYKGGFDSKDSSVNTYQLGTDSNGFIHNGSPKKTDVLKKTSNVHRIIILGGSLAMGMGASKNEKTIAAILEKKLNKKNNKKYEVLNAACGGYCSWHSVIKLSMELIRLKPDTVIEISGWNDMMHSSWGNKKNGDWIENHDRSIEDVAAAILSLQGKLSLVEFIGKKLEQSNVYLHTKQLLLRLIGQNFSLQDITWGHDKNTLSLKSKGIVNFINNLDTLNGICDVHKIRFIHLLQPNPIWQNNKLRHSKSSISDDINLHLKRYRNFDKLSRNYLNILRKYYKKFKSNKKNVYIDLSDSKKFNDNDWVDHCHLSDIGQDKLSDIIAKKF